MNTAPYFPSKLVNAAMTDYAKVAATSVYKVSLFCHYRPDFELELVTSYLDKINDLEYEYPDPANFLRKMI